MKKVLVLCTGNSCRSQIAAGYFNHFAPQLDVYSAGIETHGLNPRAVQTMLEDSIDISAYHSNHIEEYKDIHFDLVFTVCDHAKEQCPIFPNTRKQIHFSFNDPAKASGTEVEIMQVFRRVRNEIKSFVHQVILTDFKA
mgnify:CR=1 FL=1